MQGLVVKNTGTRYTVATDDGTIVHCKIKGNFRLKNIESTNPVVIGDHVDFEVDNSNDAVITSVMPRRNYMIRKASKLSKSAHILAANLDLAVPVITVNFPKTTTVFIDRFLVTAEAYQIPAHLVFNKTDRYGKNDFDYLDQLIKLYSQAGYPCTPICALTGEGMDQLHEVLKNKITLLSGHSGVGKSTIINRLVPDAKLKTAAISTYHNKGVHTTTFSEMIRLPNGGYIIDTPGIKGFGTVEMQGVEVAHYFPEIFNYSAQCKFHNCTHQQEPDCAVRSALDQGLIGESRYKSYLNILQDANEGKYREAY
jgi:ribosome biogenesis GTPase